MQGIAFSSERLMRVTTVCNILLPIDFWIYENRAYVKTDSQRLIHRLFHLIIHRQCANT